MSRGAPLPRRATARALFNLALAIFGLLALGRIAVAWAPVEVEIVGDEGSLSVLVDGSRSTVRIAQPMVVMQPLAPIHYRREHLIDGSDSTNTQTFSSRAIGQIAESPYYRLQALIREEWRYSRWRDLAVYDGAGILVAREPEPADDVPTVLPTPFRVSIALERPEIPRMLELYDASGRALVVELNRNDKLVQIAERRRAELVPLASGYFPRDWRPPLATLADLLTRAGALALAAWLLVGVLAAVVPAAVRWMPGSRTLWVAAPLLLAFLLGATVYGAVVVFDRAPHILDAVSYTFQAKTFALGALTVAAPPVFGAFPVPFAVEHEGRWFSQYPPGTAVLLAAGYLADVPWLVEPLLAVAAVLLVALAAVRQYGRGTALLVLALLVTSPLLIVQSGLFLSHIPALCFAAAAMLGVTCYADRPTARTALGVGASVGLVCLTREIVAVIYLGSVVACGLMVGRRAAGRGWLLHLAIVAGALGAAFGLYLAYNAAVAGSALLLPRLIFNPRDLYGFGKDIGFYGEHSVAAGLGNTEQLLTSLTITAAGWPFGVSLALPMLPFLTRRAVPWDAAHGCLVLLFVVAYVGYFYHGIALGPRYYLEALPSVMILTARGFVTVAEAVADRIGPLGLWRPRERAGQAAVALFLALLACNVLFFLPRQATLYAGFVGLPGGGPKLDPAIVDGPAGPEARLENALIVTDAWWYQVLYFAPLNCPRLDCEAVFALAPDSQTRLALRQAFPEREWYDVVLVGDILRFVPGTP